MCAVLARHQAQQRDAVAAASAELSTCPIDSFNVQSDEVGVTHTRYTCSALCFSVTLHVRAR